MVRQHWSLSVTDKSGTIVVGVTVFDNGVESVDAWIPGASQSNDWVFNTASGPGGAVHHVTVPGTTWTMRSHSANAG